MTARVFSIAVSALLLISLSASASEIVLTAFEPFGKLPVNNSAKVVSHLAALLRGSSVKVKTCLLPVEYDRAAAVAFECIGERSPDLVLSFGATGACELRFETVAHNHDRTGATDNAGVRRNQNTPIIEGAPETIPFNAPMRELFTRAAPSEDFPIAQSKNTGTYVCNNEAYWLATRYSTPNSKTRFGFIHVPETSCGGRTANANALAAAIFQSMRAAMPELF